MNKNLSTHFPMMVENCIEGKEDIKIKMLRSQYQFDSTKHLSLNGFIQDLYNFNKKNNSFFHGELGVELLPSSQNMINLTFLCLDEETPRDNGIGCKVDPNYNGFLSNIELLFSMQTQFSKGNMWEIKELKDKNVCRALLEFSSEECLMVMGSNKSSYGEDNKLLEKMFFK